MASRITYDTFYTNTYANLYDLISDKTKLVDPTAKTSENRKWVYTREPDTKAAGFAGYPFVIIHSPLVDFDNAAVSGTKKGTNFSAEIEVVASDRGANDQDGQGLTHLHKICDGIVKLFNATTNRNTLKANGMFNVNPTADSHTVEVIENTLVFRKSFLLTANGRKSTVA